MMTNAPAVMFKCAAPVGAAVAISKKCQIPTVEYHGTTVVLL